MCVLPIATEPSIARVVPCEAKTRGLQPIYMSFGTRDVATCRTLVSLRTRRYRAPCNIVLAQVASVLLAIELVSAFQFFAQARMDQTTLQDLWLKAPDGRLCAFEQAKALALREASKELHGPQLNLPWIAERVTKSGADAGHPSTSALHQFFALVDGDPLWFPGKHNGAKRGPKPLLTPAKRRRAADYLMKQKRERGEEPCIAALIVNEPEATWNPKTKKPSSARKLREILTEDCYDFDPECSWRFQSRLQRLFLPEPIKEHRDIMGKYLLRTNPSVQWWAQQVVWFDPCCSIQPGSQNHYDRMRQACKGGKGYISDDAKEYNANLKGSETAKKQRAEGRRICWFMVLARGVAHVELMPEDWTCNAAGLAYFVHRLPRILRRMLGPTAKLPRNVFTDRGTGMYTPVGRITKKYHEACTSEGFEVYWGADAQRQSPDMGDVLLHETAVSWFRKRMAVEPPIAAPWDETREQWLQRAQKCIRYVNRDHNVAGLCRDFPSRLRELVHREGARLPH